MVFQFETFSSVNSLGGSLGGKVDFLIHVACSSP